ncbi:MAG: hypothetical protein M3512_05865 [Bacteroidota bacterium]|nr:hypothetical protein [Bacteroidota bacterium]
MLNNPPMISLNTWDKKDFQSSCPICKEVVTLNNECCFECQLNLRPRQIFDHPSNVEMEIKIKELLSQKLHLVK